jgi:hypothetical protein
MKTPLELLSEIQVASPCAADWNQMTGDDFVRFCGECSKNVYNLSALTAEEAIDLIREHEGNLCGRFFRRADGNVLTGDCPVGVESRIRRKRRLAAIGASVLSLFGLGGCTRFEEPTSASTDAEVDARVSGPNTKQPDDPQLIRRAMVMGEICIPEDRRPIAPLGGNEQLPKPRELESQSD